MVANDILAILLVATCIYVVYYDNELCLDMWILTSNYVLCKLVAKAQANENADA